MSNKSVTGNVIRASKTGGIFLMILLFIQLYKASYFIFQSIIFTYKAIRHGLPIPAKARRKN